MRDLCSGNCELLANFSATMGKSLLSLSLRVSLSPSAANTQFYAPSAFMLGITSRGEMIMIFHPKVRADLGGITSNVSSFRFIRAESSLPLMKLKGKTLDVLLRRPYMMNKQILVRKLVWSVFQLHIIYQSLPHFCPGF